MGNAHGQATGPNSVGGLAPGTIKHVWLIILENKSYDETFTGLNKNSYLWQTLPSEGVLLKNYYGTGHSSQDNYIALASGQAPQADTQDDCTTRQLAVQHQLDIITTGVGRRRHAQLELRPGRVRCSVPNAPLGTNPSNTNGCTYPTEIPTLFRPVQRRRRQLEGLRPGPGRRPAHRLDIFRVRQRAGP